MLDQPENDSVEHKYNLLAKIIITTCKNEVKTRKNEVKTCKNKYYRQIFEHCAPKRSLDCQCIACCFPEWKAHQIKIKISQIIIRPVCFLPTMPNARRPTTSS
jgi:hypothetical protein